MAKQFWFTAAAATTHRSASDAKLNGTASFWSALAMAEARGFGVTNHTVTTVAGATNGIEVLSGTPPAEWITEPLTADFTISGTITLNLWAAESSNSANAAINAVIEKMDGATGALTQIAKTARTTELPLTTPAAANFTVAPTSTACKKGDRLRVRIFADDSSTMGSGFTVTFSEGAASAAASGDSWIQFTEDLTVETTGNPSGSRYYLTDTAETINPGSATEKKALTIRGSGSVGSVTNTATGPTAGIQITDSAGGTAIEWYTPPLEAVTLGGRASFRITALESNASANASLTAEIAIVNTDGSGAVVWGKGTLDAATTNGERGELSTTSSGTGLFARPSGDDTNVTAGQRLRFRIFVDDSGSAALVTGFTVTVNYSGVTATAVGDTYVMLPVTVTEQAGATTYTKAGYGRESL